MMRAMASSIVRIPHQGWLVPVHLSFVVKISSRVYFERNKPRAFPRKPTKNAHRESFQRAVTSCTAARELTSESLRRCRSILGFVSVRGWFRLGRSRTCLIFGSSVVGLIHQSWRRTFTATVMEPLLND